LTAFEIDKQINEEIISINDIGVSSGTSSIDITDDLEIISVQRTNYNYSLKCAKNLDTILSKNMGAKSLISEYFKDPKKQEYFDERFEQLHKEFFERILGKDIVDIRTAKAELRKIAKDNGRNKPRFKDPIFINSDKSRKIFLSEISSLLTKTLLQIDKSNLANACNLILDTRKHHILACYKKDNEFVDYFFHDIIQESDIEEIRERGNNSAIIKTKNYIIGFRYKFESDIASSVKLVGDYKEIKD